MKFLVLLILSGSAIASGDNENHGSPTDLIAAFFNVFLLAGLLIWKLKGVFKKHFEEKSKTVSEVMERANVKAKEAQMMLDMQNKKIQNLEQEIAQLHSETENDISKFRSEYSKEVQDRITKLKNDAAIKIESEKQELANELNETLIDTVIAKAKQVLKNEKSLNEKATANILEGLK